MNRRELVAILIDDLEYNPIALLDSMVASMSDDEVFKALEYVSRVEDWRHRITDQGEIVDTEKGNSDE